jgi:hypothetical protein
LIDGPRFPGVSNAEAVRRYMIDICVHSPGAVRVFRPTTILGEHIRRESTQISGYFGCPVGR